jgi:hypothetical protein
MNRGSFRKKILKAILVMASFIFIGCEKSTGEIGLGQVVDSKAVLGTLKRMPIQAYTVPFDSILSTGPSQELAGSYIDPYFGGVKARFATHVLLSLLSPDFGPEAICDSVVMLMAYRGYYGDTAVPATFVVHELQDYLDPEEKYYTNHNFKKGPEIGRITTVAKPKAPVVFNGNVFSPALRLNLDKDFFQKKVITASRLGSQYFSTNVEFIKHFKGIEVSTEGYGGAINYFNIGSLSSFIRIFYRRTTADTVSLTYDMYYGIASSGNYVSVNMFETDFSLASFNLDQQDTANGETTVYTQAYAGAVTRIILPDLKALSDSNYMINRAELIIPVREGSVGRYNLPTSLLLLQDKGDNRPFVEDYTPIGRSTSGAPIPGLPVGGTLVVDKFRERSYTFNITRMINSFINDTVSVTPFLLVPASSASQAWRAVLNGNADPLRPMELNIYYTKPKN